METSTRNLVSIPILICLFFVASTEGWRPFKVTIKNVTWESFGNFTSINATLSPTGAISVFVEVFNTLNHPFAYAEIFVDSGSGQYDFEIMNRTVNICEFFRNKYYEPLLQIFYKMLLESGPWPAACPVQKSRFSVENLIVDPEKMPPYLPERRGYTSLKFTNDDGGIKRDLNVITFFFEVESMGISRIKNVMKKRN